VKLSSYQSRTSDIGIGWLEGADVIVAKCYTGPRIFWAVLHKEMKMSIPEYQSDCQLLKKDCGPRSYLDERINYGSSKLTLVWSTQLWTFCTLLRIAVIWERLSLCANCSHI
jgi:hypothetical protein